MSLRRTKSHRNPSPVEIVVRLCVYFLQVLKSDYEGTACKIYFLMPSNFEEKMPFFMMAFMIIKSKTFGRYFPLYSDDWIFETKFFPLGFEGI